MKQRQPTFTVYPRRFWILALVTLLNIPQTCYMITYTVSFDETIRLYGWSKATIDLMVSWSTMIYVATVLFVSPLLTKVIQSTRQAITISAFLTALGAGLRAIITPNETNAQTTLLCAHLGAIFIGLSGVILGATPSRVSAEWFSPLERTTATSVQVMAAYGGFAASYAFGMVIKSPRILLQVLRAEAAIAGVLFVITLLDNVFFNDIPPTPPSATQFAAINSADETVEEDNSPTTLTEIQYLLKNRNFLWFVFWTGLFQGAFGGFQSIIGAVLGPSLLGYSEVMVSALGSGTTLAVMISCVLFGFITDFSLMKRKMKHLIVGLALTSGLCLLIFSTAMINKQFNAFGIPWFHIGQTGAMFFGVLGAFLNAGTTGIAYESCVEMAYPHVGEVTVVAFFSLTINLWCAMYIQLNSVFEPGTMLYLMSYVSIISACCLSLYQQSLKRSAVDIQGFVQPKESESSFGMGDVFGDDKTALFQDSDDQPAYGTQVSG